MRADYLKRAGSVVAKLGLTLPIIDVNAF
jgi:hypothetical protein